MSADVREATKLVWASARTLAAAMRGESVRARAMALSYISLFAVVPALVVAFSFVQAFGATEKLWRGVHEYLLDNLAVGARTSIEPYLDRFVRNAHATSAGLVGGAILVVSAVSLFHYVERAVNDIWAVRRLRPLPQRVLIYWAGLTLGPVLLGGSLALAHAVGTLLEGALVGQVLARLAAILLSCVLFTALYLFVPSTRVRFRAAAIGGLVAGIAWELAKMLYTFVVARFFRYHAIYGSVAAVPIFLLWMFVSWTLVLLGARVSFVVQHARVLLRGHAATRTPLGRELLAARAMLEVALAYRDGSAPPDPGDVADRLETFGEQVRDVVGALRLKQLIVELSGGGLVPARPLDAISLGDVRRAVSGDPPEAAGTASEALVTGILSGAERTAAEKLGEWNYAELCARLRPRDVPAVAEAAGRAP